MNKFLLQFFEKIKKKKNIYDYFTHEAFKHDIIKFNKLTTNNSFKKAKRNQRASKLIMISSNISDNESDSSVSSPASAKSLRINNSQTPPPRIDPLIFQKL